MTVSIIGGLLYIIAIDERFPWQSSYQGRLARDVLAALTEELIRYPAIVVTQNLVGRLNLHDTEILQLQPSHYVEGQFTTILDPHGMGMFFGTAYGLGETVAFYVYPTVKELILGTADFPVGQELTNLLFRITAVMAHITLTYLAMAITSQRGFWRVTIILHLLSNVSNRLFIESAANEYATIVFVVFTRFAIVLIGYFLLRPRVRYLSPAVLIFLLVTLFLLVVLISTFIALLVGLITANILRPL